MNEGQYAKVKTLHIKLEIQIIFAICYSRVM